MHTIPVFPDRSSDRVLLSVVCIAQLGQEAEEGPAWPHAAEVVSVSSGGAGEAFCPKNLIAECNLIRSSLSLSLFSTALPRPLIG